jgi:hypothetical protein
MRSSVGFKRFYGANVENAPKRRENVVTEAEIGKVAKIMLTADSW